MRRAIGPLALALALLLLAAPVHAPYAAEDEPESDVQAAFDLIRRAIAQHAKRGGTLGTLPGAPTRPAVSQLSVRDEFSDAQLLGVLQEQRSDAKIVSKTLLQYRHKAGVIIEVRNKGRGGVQFRFARTGGKWSKASMNVWNRDKRPSKAYIDHEDDPVFELDVLTMGGVTLDIIRHNVDLFDNALATFASHLKATNQK